ncbi:hypothetical protein [Candidatus Coxiella mudrowiae]|uniref:hypothetical protein n=1 Tax=Candidatus Coxiella mudrowiae TaxID=2054173 RepID=UPI0006620BAA|nr:hypothetical protein [Candidatus Coxiella mudrowiae]
MDQRISNFGKEKQEYLRHYNAFTKKINGVKAIVAQYWIFFVVFLVCFFLEIFTFTKEKINLLTPIMMTAMLTIFIHYF